MIVCRIASATEPEAYAFPLSQPIVRDYHRKILVANRRAPGLSIDLDVLTVEAEEVSFRSINSKYGRLGHFVADLIGIVPAHYSPISTRPLRTTALAEGGRAGPARSWYWKVYFEVAAAIDLLGWDRG